MMTKTEKIALLRKTKMKNKEVAKLYDIVCLYYPNLLDDPEHVSKADINGYNRLVRTTVSVIEIQAALLI